MALEVFKILGSVAYDGRDAERGMERTEQKAGSLSRAFERMAATVRQTGAAIRSAGQMMTAAISVPATVIGTNLIRAAADAEETSSKFDVAFGDMADEVRAFAHEMAEQMGRSRFQMEEFMSGLQAILSPLLGNAEAAAEMSKQLSVLAIDLASFMNLSEEETLERLRSGLLGSTEAVDQLGINLRANELQLEAQRLGIKGNIATLDEATKVQLRFNAIMRQTALAQGDAIRTADSTTNRIRRLQAAWRDISVTLGQELLPIADAVLSRITQWLDAFKQMPSELRRIVLAIGGLVAALGPALLVVGMFTSGIGSLVNLFSLGALPILAFVAAIGGLILALRRLMTTNKGTSTGLLGNWSELRENGTEVWENLRDRAIKSWEGISVKAEEIWTPLRERLIGIWSSLQNWWSKHGFDIGPIFSGISDAAGEVFINLLAVLRELGEIVKEVWTPIIEAVSPLLVEALRLVLIVIEPVLRLLAELLEITAEWLDKAPPWIRNIIGLVIGFRLMAGPIMLLIGLFRAIIGSRIVQWFVGLISWLGRATGATTLLRLGWLALQRLIMTVLLPAFAALVSALGWWLVPIAAVVAALAGLIIYWDDVKNAAIKAADWITDRWQEFKDWISGVLDSIGNWIDGLKSRWENLKETVSKPFKVAGQFVSDTASGIRNWISQRIPAFQSGGVFQAPPGRRTGLAMLHDGEVVLNQQQQRIFDPDAIGRAVARYLVPALESASDTGQAPQVVLQIGETEFGRLVRRAISSEKRRLGVEII